MVLFLLIEAEGLVSTEEEKPPERSHLSCRSCSRQSCRGVPEGRRNPSRREEDEPEAKLVSKNQGIFGEICEVLRIHRRQFRKIRDLEITVGVGKGDLEKTKEELSSGREWFTAGVGIGWWIYAKKTNRVSTASVDPNKGKIGIRIGRFCLIFGEKSSV
ncbi:hypothetical protein U1Q18_044038 [Sarracenia purpurea var. burkii]